jgi:hypothetical protein
LVLTACREGRVSDRLRSPSGSPSFSLSPSKNGELKGVGKLEFWRDQYVRPDRIAEKGGLVLTETSDCEATRPTMAVPRMAWRDDRLAAASCPAVRPRLHWTQTLSRAIEPLLGCGATVAFRLGPWSGAHRLFIGPTGKDAQGRVRPSHGPTLSRGCPAAKLDEPEDNVAVALAGLDNSRAAPYYNALCNGMKGRQWRGVSRWGI